MYSCVLPYFSPLALNIAFLHLPLLAQCRLMDYICEIRMVVLSDEPKIFITRTTAESTHFLKIGHYFLHYTEEGLKPYSRACV